MAKIETSGLLVGLDIGTHSIKAVLGEVLDDGDINVLGVGNHLVKGMDKGGVNDLNLVSDALKRAVEEMELMADCRVSSAILGISGRHIGCQNEHGMVPINHNEVTQDDIVNVIHAARSVPIPADRRILHVLPQEYSVDVQENVKNPLGMSGVRMEANVHIITCADDMAKNFIKCTDRCGISIDSTVFSALASSHSILTEDEKELGVCLVDIGAGTVDITIYADACVRYSAVIPIGGNQITNDIAKIFRTPLNHAEQIKISQACALKDLVSMEETINVPSVGGREDRSMSRHTLAEVIEPRFHEILELVYEHIRDSGLFEQVAAGVVLTGGTSKMPGALELAESIFSLPVRIGKPMNIKGLTDYVNDPTYAQVIGLLHYGKLETMENISPIRNTEEGIFHRIKAWFKGEF
jgi:cell division protein FtsA